MERSSAMCSFSRGKRWARISATTRETRPRVSAEEGAIAEAPSAVKDGRTLGHLLTEIGLDQGEREVDAGAHAGRGPDRAVVDEDTVHVDRAVRKLLLQLASVHPMRRDPPSVEQTRFP